jgi:hypothetical protein
MARTMAGTAMLIRMNLDDEFCPLAPLAGVEALPAEAQAEIRDRIRSLEHGYPEIAAEGLADGSVRDVDLTGAAIAFAGVFGWLHKWFSPDLVAPEVVLEEQLKLMAGGLRAR